MNIGTSVVKEKTVKPVKHIFVCIDGSWCGYYSQSNIIKIAGKVRNEIPSSENAEIKCGYFQGVGNGGGIFYALIGGMTGFDLESKVQEAYKFVCKEWDPKKTNKVWIIGFSRGAYSARMLAQRINTVGVVTHDTCDKNSLWFKFIEFLLWIPFLILFFLEKFLPFIVFSILQNTINSIGYLAASSRFKANEEKASLFHRCILQKFGFPSLSILRKVERLLKLQIRFSASFGSRQSYCAELKKAAEAENLAFSSEIQPNSKSSVHFLGLFESVGSVGLPPFEVEYNNKIDNVNEVDGKIKIVPNFGYTDAELKISETIPHVYHALGAYESLNVFEPQELPTDRLACQKIFPGIHVDIGGSFLCNPISDIVGDWMIGHINKALEEQRIPHQLHNITRAYPSALEYPINPIVFCLRFVVHRLLPFISTFTVLNISSQRPRDFLQETDNSPTSTEERRAALYNNGEGWAKFSSQLDYFPPSVIAFNNYYRF